MTKLYVKRDEFSFLIVNFPFICGNIPSASAHGVFISHLIRHVRACRYYADCFAPLYTYYSWAKWLCFKIEFITTKVLWSSSRTFGSLRCIHLHYENHFVQRVIVFLFSFVYHGPDFILAARQVFQAKQRTLTQPVQRVHAPSISGVRFADF